MRRRTVAALPAALALVVALASPAPAATSTRVHGNRVEVDLGVDVRGDKAARTALARQAAALARARLWGCFSLQPKVVPDSDPSSHVVTVLPQRPGQFVRQSFGGSEDPYEGRREITVGALALESPDPMAGPLPLLLAQPRDAATVSDLIDYVLRRTGAQNRVKACKWNGTLEITTTFEKYHLTLTSSTTFTFNVTARSVLEGEVLESTRSGSVSESEVGSCSGSGLPMFGIQATGNARNGLFEFVFHAKGDEPDFTLSCSRGTVTFTGDFLRAAFLPIGLRVTTRIRAGATATAKIDEMGRVGEAKVTITRA